MKKSIKHLPKRTQEELTVLLDLVCKSVDNCQMIILFGSYARGNYVLWDTKIEFGVRTSYQSDYDILVITNGAVKRAERKLERILTNIMICLNTVVTLFRNSLSNI